MRTDIFTHIHSLEFMKECMLLLVRLYGYLYMVYWTYTTVGVCATAARESRGPPHRDRLETSTCQSARTCIAGLLQCTDSYSTVLLYL